MKTRETGDPRIRAGSPRSRSLKLDIIDVELNRRVEERGEHIARYGRVGDRRVGRVRRVGGRVRAVERRESLIPDAEAERARDTAEIASLSLPRVMLVAP